jgi:hypothetical protein
LGRRDEFGQRYTLGRVLKPFGTMGIVQTY